MHSEIKEILEKAIEKKQVTREEAKSIQIVGMSVAQINELLFDEYSIQAFREHLITPEQAVILSADQLRTLFGGRFLKIRQHHINALREHLITPEQVARLSARQIMALFRYGLDALHEQLITPEQVALLSPDKIWALLGSESRLQSLREQLITPEQAVRLPADVISALVGNELCLQALRDGLITLKQAALLSPDQISALLGYEQRIQALREHLIAPEQAIHLSGNHIRELLENEQSIQALRDGLITPQQAAILSPQQIKTLFGNERHIRALRERLITLKQTAHLSVDHMKVLLRNEQRIQALRERLITPEQAVALSVDQLKALLGNEQRIQALREHLITPAQAAALSPEQLQALLGDELRIQSLREYRITPQQALPLSATQISELMGIQPAYTQFLHEHAVHVLKKCTYPPMTAFLAYDACSVDKHFYSKIEAEEEEYDFLVKFSDLFIDYTRQLEEIAYPLPLLKEYYNAPLEYYETYMPYDATSVMTQELVNKTEGFFGALDRLASELSDNPDLSSGNPHMAKIKQTPVYASMPINQDESKKINSLTHILELEQIAKNIAVERCDARTQIQNQCAEEYLPRVTSWPRFFQNRQQLSSPEILSAVLFATGCLYGVGCGLRKIYHYWSQPTATHKKNDDEVRPVDDYYTPSRDSCQKRT